MSIIEPLLAEGKSAEYICSIYDSRRNDPSERWRQEAAVICRLMDGDLWSPVSERMGDSEQVVIANTALLNLEQMARRAVSTQPNVKYVSVRPGSKQSDDRARKRQLANLGFWDKNNMKLIDRKRVRWLQGFGMGPVQIGPHETLQIPKWSLRDPLSCYPAPTDFQDSFTPPDCVYAYTRSYSWLKANYPDKASEFSSEYSRRNDYKLCPPDLQLEMLEYIDDAERVLIALSRKAYNPIPLQQTMKSDLMLIVSRVENRLGICPVVAPRLININRLKSPYFGNAGIFEMRNRLAALEYIFAEKSVFPERYFIEQQNGNGEIVAQANAREGHLGHVRGGTIQDFNMQPNFAGTQMGQRLEREERLNNSTPAEFGGESASNIRTGKRGDSIMSAAVDFTIQETQEILALAKQQENKLAAKVDRTYFNKPKAFYIGWEGFRNQQIDYKPGDIWESDENHVFYAAAGNDVNQHVISGGQRVAQGTMSRETFMESDPLVEDVEAEKDRIQAEQLRQAGFTQLMQPGAIPPVALAKMASYIATNQMEWWDALDKVNEELKQAQASDGQPGDPNGPVPEGSPEAQPGLAPEAQQPTIQGPNSDQQNIAAVLGALRRPQMTVNGA